jgi:predicted O-methyltransferase YrrM
MASKTLSQSIHYLPERLSEPFREKHGIRTPRGTDWVGYEALIGFIKTNGIMSVDGDAVEIGTFLGGGAYKLAKFLESRSSHKKLFVIDVFDPTFDWTTNTSGNAMNTLYASALKKYKGKSQREIFQEETKECQNITVLAGDSKKSVIPTKSICFAFIDGNHSPDYVESDFYLIWDKLSPGGAIAFHDYDGDLPETTKKINELVNKHRNEIKSTLVINRKKILFLIKKSSQLTGYSPSTKTSQNRLNT